MTRTGRLGAQRPVGIIGRAIQSYVDCVGT